jgi:Spx/MgsR family transcriptional regulator
MKILGIKNCDKVKKTFVWCKENNIEFCFHDFRTDGISHEILSPIIEQNSIESLVNKRSTTWRTLTEQQKENLNPALLIEYPTLIKRPVVELNGKIHLGYFPEKWQQ